MSLNVQINASTSLYAVFGDPVSHSLSPIMHNAAFSSVDHNGVYLAFRVQDIGKAISGMKSLGIKGVSITIPHKINVMKYLDQIDEMADKIGAVNTIINEDGILTGFNTDGLGAVNALKEKTEIENKITAIIGAGGAARAIGYEMRSRGAKVIIFNRTIDKGEKLAEEIGADFRPLSDIKGVALEIIINTTPLGMVPNVLQMPIQQSVIEKDMVVMDAVYNPLTTQLLKTALEKGCIIVNGADMFVNQGVLQFKLWTPKNAPVDIMKQVVMKALGENC